MLLHEVRVVSYAMVCRQKNKVLTFSNFCIEHLEKIGRSLQSRWVSSISIELSELVTNVVRGVWLMPKSVASPSQLVTFQCLRRKIPM